VYIARIGRLQGEAERPLRCRSLSRVARFARSVKLLIDDLPYACGATPIVDVVHLDRETTLAGDEPT